MVKVGALAHLLGDAVPIQPRHVEVEEDEVVEVRLDSGGSWGQGGCTRGELEVQREWIGPDARYWP